MNHHKTPFGEIVYSYTRAQAVANGYQIEVTKAARKAGIKFAQLNFATSTAFPGNEIFGLRGQKIS